MTRLGAAAAARDLPRPDRSATPRIGSFGDAAASASSDASACAIAGQVSLGGAARLG